MPRGWVFTLVFVALCGVSVWLGVAWLAENRAVVSPEPAVAPAVEASRVAQPQADEVRGSDRVEVEPAETDAAFHAASFTLRVLDLGDAPIAGAVARFVEPGREDVASSTGAPDPGDSGDTADAVGTRTPADGVAITTDGSGVARIDDWPRARALLVSKEGYAPAALSRAAVRGNPREVVVRLAGVVQASVSGIVFDGPSVRVADAIVRIEAVAPVETRGARGANSRPTELRTDAQGEFRCDAALPRTMLRVSAQKDEGADTLIVPPLYTGEHRRGLVLDLSRRAPIRVEVVEGESGAPICGAVVAVVPERSAATPEGIDAPLPSGGNPVHEDVSTLDARTDADGCCVVFRPHDDPVVLHLSAPFRAPLDVSVTTADRGLRVEMFRKRRVFFRVVDAEGEPAVPSLPGSRMSMRVTSTSNPAIRESCSVAWIDTTHTGCTWTGMPDPLTLELLRAVDAATAGTSDAVIARGFGTAAETIELVADRAAVRPMAVLRFRVIDEDRRPFAGAVAVRLIPRDAREVARQYDLTSLDGSYEIVGLTTGEYAVVLSDRGGTRSAVLPAVRAVEGSTVDAGTGCLERKGRLRITMPESDPPGAPRQFRIWHYRAECYIDSLPFLSVGSHMWMQDVPAGRMRVEHWRNFRLVSSVELTIPPGGEAEASL